MNKGFSREEKVFMLLSSIFVTLLVISNVIATKMIAFGNLIGPAAVICYAITFALSDTLAEIWGKERVKFVILLGFLASVVSAIMVVIAIQLPTASFWEHQKEFELILGSNIRIVIASMLAYLASQYHDIWAFEMWKRLTKGKFLWIRNNLSTTVSQLIDTIIFIVVAFYGTGAPILSLIAGQYVLKLMIAVLDTPLVYLLIGVIRRQIEGTSASQAVQVNS